MKASVEPLSPTRVKLNVEVPFEELAPAVDAAYRRVARQVRIQGFRPGKVPPRILDQRVGRAAVLEEALQDAIPRLYSEAVAEQNVPVVGRPEIELESFADNAPLVFSAAVDVRPEITLPPYDGIPVTVDDATVTDELVDQQLGSLVDRFATLEEVDRPAGVGDYVLIDIKATSQDGTTIPGSEATGLSYEVGSEGLVPGLDRALLGLPAGGSKSFDAEIEYGDLAGTPATFDVTVTAVKEKKTPALDDEFARMASEFDTLAELRADVAARLERIRRLEQGVQARDRLAEALLARVDVPLPEAMVAAELAWRSERAQEMTGREVDESMTAELRPGAEQAVKAELILDAIADKEELSVNEAELTDQVVRRAARIGVAPDSLAQQIVNRGEVPQLVAEIRRGKALALVLEQATITDTAGRPVDLAALRDDAPTADADADAELATGGTAGLGGQPDDQAAGQPTGQDAGDHAGHDHA